MKGTNPRILSMVQLGMFSAIILLLAFIPGLGYIPLGVTRATTLHIPVIIGSIVLGPKKGAGLGALFGLTSLISNTFSPTATSFVFSPFYSIGEASGGLLSLVICFVPRILTGVVPFYVYRLLSRKGRKEDGKGHTAALALAGFAGSMTNTLLVMNMIYLFFGPSYSAAKGTAYELLYGVIWAVIGTNGIPEAIVAAVLVSAVAKVLLHFHFAGTVTHPSASCR